MDRCLKTARNNGFGIARARTDFYLKPPPLIRNEYGGSIGGPIWLPKVYNGKNKTFFFFSYEGDEATPVHHTFGHHGDRPPCAAGTSADWSTRKAASTLCTTHGAPEPIPSACLTPTIRFPPRENALWLSTCTA